MKINYSNDDPNQVVSLIEQNLSGRKLGKLVSLDLSGDQLIVTLSKMGTSKLFFDLKNVAGGVEFLLTEEKVALSHRAFKNEVKEKLVSVIENTGGRVE